MTQLLIKNAKLRNTNRQSDLLIDRGKFQKIGTGIKAAPDAQVIDADGNLVCPPIADPHVHLDAVLVAGLLTRKNQTGTLLEAIDIWGEWREHLTKDLLKTIAR